MQTTPFISSFVCIRRSEAVLNLPTIIGVHNSRSRISAQKNKQVLLNHTQWVRESLHSCAPAVACTGLCGCEIH